MNRSIINDDFFTVPLTLAAHQSAQQFYQKQSNAKRAKQVYLNTLAVYAVSSYLQWFGIETDLESSDSWNPVLQTLANPAALSIKGFGQLECCPVLPGVEVLKVSPEVRSNRIGYVAVQVNRDLTEATLLGFVPQVEMDELPLDQLRSLDLLLEQLSPPVQIQETTTPAIRLAQWLEGVFATGWRSLETLLESQQPALSFRNMPQQVVSAEMAQSVARGKLLDLGRSPQSNQIALLVQIMPIDQSEMDIWAKVCPTNQQTYLPAELELMVLDEAGIAVMQAQSRETEMIQLKFKGTPGEQFSIKVTLGDVSVTELFII
jgi:hypothetical protein